MPNKIIRGYDLIGAHTHSVSSGPLAFDVPRSAYYQGAACHKMAYHINPLCNRQLDPKGAREDARTGTGQERPARARARAHPRGSSREASKCLDSSNSF
jgi:hypothetical protein